VLAAALFDGEDHSLVLLDLMVETTVVLTLPVGVP
jgi:hypothetical protein